MYFDKKSEWKDHSNSHAKFIKGFKIRESVCVCDYLAWIIQRKLLAKYVSELKTGTIIKKYIENKCIQKSINYLHFMN